MHVDDLDISPSKIGETAQRIIDRAIEEARRREHALLTNEHIFLAFAQVEWDMFAEVMRDVELNPHTILQAIEEHLHMMPSFAGPRPAGVAGDEAGVQARASSREPRRTADASRRSTCSRRSSRRRRACRCRSCAATASSPSVLVSRLNARMRDMELREERLKKRFELPPFLKHFATNLNLLARQDKLPPVFGRDKEIQQVLEILCHRERANSVMLIGEPGRRQDGDRRRAGAAHRVRARHRAGPAARLPGRQPADEHDGRRARCCAACSRIGSRTSSAS